jgi:hypothetical protein
MRAKGRKRSDRRVFTTGDTGNTGEQKKKKNYATTDSRDSTDFLDRNERQEADISPRRNTEGRRNRRKDLFGHESRQGRATKHTKSSILDRSEILFYGFSTFDPFPF